MKKTARKAATAVLAVAMAAGTSGCIGSDTAGLSPGDCVQVTAGFTFSGSAWSVPCGDVRLFTDNYRVEAVGSESEMDQICNLGLIIVDGDDAACLKQ